MMWFWHHECLWFMLTNMMMLALTVDFFFLVTAKAKSFKNIFVACNSLFYLNPAQGNVILSATAISKVCKVLRISQKVCLLDVL
mmetsp:Transcript_19086/g.29488  ORF Transcript_19086/g.29488 Transcript_19086/m.29488 type:complete len:84 (-) Transcript_19086:316-567(-)